MSPNHNLESMVEKLIHEHFELDESLEEVIWFKPEATPKRGHAGRMAKGSAKRNSIARRRALGQA